MDSLWKKAKKCCDLTYIKKENDSGSVLRMDCRKNQGDQLKSQCNNAGKKLMVACTWVVVKGMVKNYTDFDMCVLDRLDVGYEGMREVNDYFKVGLFLLPK